MKEKDELAMLWYGKVRRGDKLQIPGEAGIWTVRKATKVREGEDFQAILVRRDPCA